MSGSQFVRQLPALPGVDETLNRVMLRRFLGGESISELAEDYGTTEGDLEARVRSAAKILHGFAEKAYDWCLANNFSASETLEARDGLSKFFEDGRQDRVRAYRESRIRRES